MLEYAQTHLDVQTISGDASSIPVLEKAELKQTELFMAVTTFENDNLIASLLAKKLGARQTIARINHLSNLKDEFRKTFSELGVDKIISPSLLAAQEIIRLLENNQMTDIFDFEEGRVSLIGLTVEETSPYI